MTTRWSKLSDSLRHHLLLATPALDEGFFAGSVTYICEHGESGAMGLVINQPLDIELGDILSHLDIETTDGPTIETVYAGGPVQCDSGFVLHRGGGVWDQSRPIADDIWLTTSRDVLSAIAAGNGPTDHLVALGYAGWGPGQLEEELTDNSWLTVAADCHIVFELPTEDRLSAAAAKLGIDIRLMSKQMGHA